MHDLVQMIKVLNVAGIVPTEVTAGLGATNCNRHGLNPQLVFQVGEAPFERILYVGETVSALESVAFGTDGVRNVAELLSRFAILRRDAEALTGHF